MLEVKNFNMQLADEGRLFKENIDIALRPGETTLLYGPSGSGKTTLFEAITYLSKPQEGEVYWDGRKIASLREANRLRKETISINFSYFNFIELLSIRDNIVMPAAMAKQQGIEKKLDNIIERFSFGSESTGDKRFLSLGDMLYAKDKHGHTRKISDLSNGQKEIVAIARAMMLDAPFMVVDEMLRSFPEKTRPDIWKIVEEYLKEKEMGIFFITHWEEMKNLASDATVLNIAEEGELIKEEGKQ